MDGSDSGSCRSLPFVCAWRFFWRFSRFLGVLVVDLVIFVAVEVVVVGVLVISPVAAV